MTITMSAVYEHGILRLEAPLNIQERATVRVTIEGPAPAATDDPTGWKAIDALRGIVKGAPRDVSTHHDKYLYGEHEK